MYVPPHRVIRPFNKHAHAHIDCILRALRDPYPTQTSGASRSDIVLRLAWQGGIRPHMFCLPVLKRETHRLDLVKAATSGNPKFFLGTDTAPHAREAKLSACGESNAPDRMFLHQAIHLVAGYA